jgi:putative DNA primase/helicase
MYHYDYCTVLNAARDKWDRILDALGVNHIYLKDKHGPCPFCGGTDRFRFDDINGNGTFFCNQCNAGNGITFVMYYKRCTFQQALELIGRQLGLKPNEPFKSAPKPALNYIKDVLEAPQTRKRKAQLSKIWREALPISKGDPVDTYLRNRGICLDLFPSELRYHPTLPYYQNGNLLGHFQAMIGLITDVNERGMSLHRTYLESGFKADVPAPKKIISPIFRGATNGASIKLFSPANHRIAIAEGIETSFAFHQATKIPTWAAITANGMEKIILPSSIKEIVIVVDNDESGRGQKAGFVLAQRLLEEGRSVKRVMPEKLGTDFADELLRGVE